MALSIARLEYGDLVAFTWSRTVVKNGLPCTESFPQRAIYLGYYTASQLLMVDEKAAMEADWMHRRRAVHEMWVEPGEVVGKYRLLYGQWFDYNADHQILVEYHTQEYEVPNHPYGGFRMAGGEWTSESFTRIAEAEEFCGRNKAGKAFISIIDGYSIPGPSIRVVGSE